VVRLCNAQRYERSAARRDSRAAHYERGLYDALAIPVPPHLAALVKQLETQERG